ncbi:MAG: N-6 DNA methylase [Saprospiraceae bacterium]|nr:N-6 DNA methylase [Saprospiraceae bacterium]
MVKLIVEIIEPFKGRIFDPACGSGGMFVQSAKFIKRHALNTTSLSVWGQERTGDTVNLAKMNLAVNGLSSDISNSNSYYDDPFKINEKIREGRHDELFDYVMANPPFNVSNVVEESVKNQPRFNHYGLPVNKGKPAKTKEVKQATFGNGNYLWATLFATALKPTGRAGFVMANSASDARNTELEIRQRMIESELVDVIISVSSNFFYTVTLPITIWFYDKAKAGTERGQQILFIDARNTYRQVNRAIREFTQVQVYNLTAIVWLYRGEHDKFRDLVEFYHQTLHRWQSGTVLSPSGEERYYGLDNAEEACGQALTELFDAFDKWYRAVAKGLDQKALTAAAPFEMERKLAIWDAADLVAAHKALVEMVDFADKNLKPKGDKTFGQANIRNLQKAATAALAKWQFVRERIAYFQAQLDWLEQHFPDGGYTDVEGLCKMASLDEVREQGFSLNPGRYVGVALEEDSVTKEEFRNEMLELHNELAQLNKQAGELERTIDGNLKYVLA